MPFGFYIIMAAQFFSALADNALLIAAIAALRDMHAPSEYEPLLKTFFTDAEAGPKQPLNPQEVSLSKAISLDPKYRKVARRDPDLTSVRDEPEFSRVLGESGK